MQNTNTNTEVKGVRGAPKARPFKGTIRELVKIFIGQDLSLMKISGRRTGYYKDFSVVQGYSTTETKELDDTEIFQKFKKAYPNASDMDIDTNMVFTKNHQPVVWEKFRIETVVVEHGKVTLSDLIKNLVGDEKGFVVEGFLDEKIGEMQIEIGNLFQVLSIINKANQALADAFSNSMRLKLNELPTKDELVESK